MSKPLPKWIMKKFARLWNTFGKTPLNYKEIKKILKEESETSLRTILTTMRKSRWLKVRRNPEDRRKKIYQLREPEEIIGKMEI